MAKLIEKHLKKFLWKQVNSTGILHFWGSWAEPVLGAILINSELRSSARNHKSFVKLILRLSNNRMYTHALSHNDQNG